MNNSILQILFIFFIGLVLVYYLIPIIVNVSKAKHFFDEPNERRVNATRIPNLGGVALFIGITIATLFGIHYWAFPDFSYILIAMIIMLFVGLKDDIMLISAKEKLVAQIVCALILIIPGDIRISNLHGIFGITEINYISSVLISLLAIVSIINAINLVDGIDGLAAAIGILTTIILGISFLLDGHFQYAMLCFAITGSLSSFLFFNVFGSKNKIFMGDTGSLLIGLLLSVICIKYNEFSLNGNKYINSFSPIFSMAILAVPLFDMMRVFIIRILHKKSPFAPDNKHIHHQLLLLGYSHVKSTMLIIGINLIFIGIVFALRAYDNNLLLLILGSMVLSFLLLPSFIIKYKNQKLLMQLQLEKTSQLVLSQDNKDSLLITSNETNLQNNALIDLPSTGI
jgi:UDP-GlcNAc:undecaprenyl-phosphate/decaprenyl-phosphate GlcNAc-1-phosphate transferase